LQIPISSITIIWQKVLPIPIPILLLKSVVYSDMMLMSKQYSSIYFRCKTAVLAFTLSVTTMPLMTDLTSAPDDKSIGIEYYQKISEKVSPILSPMLEKYRRCYW